MATARERSRFIARLVREFPDKPSQKVKDAANALLRHARTYHRLAEEARDGPTTLRPDWEANLETRQERVEQRIDEICGQLGTVAYLSTDPRGYVVKIKLPSAAGDPWAEGYGVPV